MKKFSFGFVLGFIPQSIEYLAYGFISGSIVGLILFYADKSLYLSILQSWSNRLLFGARILDNHYSIWFALNNLFALALAILGIMLLLFMFRRRKKFRNNRFASYEKHHPKVSLYSLYMIPIGVVFINSFFISFLLIYVYFSQGYAQLIKAVALLLPNGLNEILALLFASSLGLAYLKIIEPQILKGKWDEAIQTAKKLVLSQTSLYFVVFIAILIIFAAFLEGREFGLLIR